ncbi:hypothetical protein BC936DRAFT_137373 [Jimgerdemannia flammicorona]|uniref:Uncharacterized protein n=1 Tax=Jimgerdemannia flammicorona TaxID=994334 RepID=A0A433CXH7_9FUNG|nr:hypothetical protein BC936DRAFT_137373 [Jimgerdemannia flammicorona]
MPPLKCRTLHRVLGPPAILQPSFTLHFNFQIPPKPALRPPSTLSTYTSSSLPTLTSRLPTPNIRSATPSTEMPPPQPSRLARPTSSSSGATKRPESQGDPPAPPPSGLKRPASRELVRETGPPPTFGLCASSSSSIPATTHYDHDLVDLRAALARTEHDRDDLRRTLAEEQHAARMAREEAESHRGATDVLKLKLGTAQRDFEEVKKECKAILEQQEREMARKLAAIAERDEHERERLVMEEVWKAQDVWQQKLDEEVKRREGVENKCKDLEIEVEAADRVAVAMQQRLAELAAQVKGLETANESLEKEKKITETTAKETERSLYEADALVSELRSEIQRKDSSICELKTRLTESEQARRDTDAQLQQAKLVTEKMSSQNAEELARMRDHHWALERDLAQSSDLAEFSANETTCLREQVTTLTAQLDAELTRRTCVEEVQAQCGEARATAAVLEETVATLRRELEQAGQNTRQADRNHTAWMENLEREQSCNKEMEKQLEQHDETMRHHEAELVRVAAICNVQEDTIRKLNENASALQGKKAELERAIEDAMHQIASYKEDMARLHSDAQNTEQASAEAERFQGEIHARDAAIGELNMNIAVLQDELGAARASIDEQDDRIVAHGEDIVRLEAMLRAADEKAAELGVQAQKMAVEETEMREEIVTMRERFTEADKMVSELSGRVVGLQAALDAKTAEVEGMVGQREHAVEEVSKLKEELATVMELRDIAVKKYEEETAPNDRAAQAAQGKVDELSAQISMLETGTKEKASEIQQLRQQVSAAQSTINELNEQVSNLQDDLGANMSQADTADQLRQTEVEELRRARKELLASVTQCEDAMRGYREEIARLEGEVRAKEEIVQSLVERVGSLEAEKGPTEEIVRQLRWQVENANAVVEDLRSKVLKLQSEAQEQSGHINALIERDEENRETIDALKAAKQELSVLVEQKEQGIQQQKRIIDSMKTDMQKREEFAVEFEQRLASLQDEIAIKEEEHGAIRALLGDPGMSMAEVAGRIAETKAQLEQQTFRVNGLLCEQEAVLVRAQAAQAETAAEVERKEETVRQCEAELERVRGELGNAEHAAENLVEQVRVLKGQVAVAEERQKEIQVQADGVGERVRVMGARGPEDEEALTRLQEVERVKANLEAVIAEKEATLERLRAESSEAKESHAAILDEFRSRYEEVLRTNNDLTLGIEQERSTVESQQSRLAQLEEENTGQKESVDILSESLEDLENTLAQRDRDLAAMKQKMDELDGTVVRLESELALESTRAADLMERDTATPVLEMQRTKLEELENLLMAKVLEEDGYKAKIASMEVTMSALRDEIEQMGVTTMTRGLETELREATEKLRLTEQMYMESDSKIKELEQELGLSRIVVTELECKWSQAKQSVADIEVAFSEACGRVQQAEEIMAKNGEEKNALIATMGDLESAKQELDCLLETERQRHVSRDAELDNLMREIDNQQVIIQRQATNLRTLCFEFDEKAALLDADSRKDKEVIENLRRDLAEVQSKSKQLEQTVEAKNKMIKHLELDTKDYEITVKETNATLAKLRNEVKAKNELIDELTVKEGENASEAAKQVQELTAQFETIRAENAHMREFADAKMAEIKVLAAEMDALRSHKDYHDRRVTEYDRTVQSLRDEVERLRSKQLAPAVDESTVCRVRELEQLVGKQMDEIVGLRARMADADEAKRDMEREVARLEKLVQEREKENAELNMKLSEVERVIAAKKAEVDEMKVAIDELKLDRQDLQVKLDAAERSVKKLDATNVELDATVEKLQGSLKVKTSELADLKENLSVDTAKKLTNAHEEIASRQTKLRTQASSVGGKQKETQRAVETLERTVNNLRNSVQLKETQIAKFEEDVSGHLEALEERAKTIAQLEDKVAELTEMTTKLEETLQNNATDQEHTDDKYMTVLKENRKLKDKMELYKKQNKALQVKLQEVQEKLVSVPASSAAGPVQEVAHRDGDITASPREPSEDDRLSAESTSTSAKSNARKRPLSTSVGDSDSDSNKRRMTDKTTRATPAPRQTRSAANATVAEDGINFEMRRTRRSGPKDAPTAKTVELVMEKKFPSDVVKLATAVGSPLQEVTNIRGPISPAQDRKKGTQKKDAMVPTTGELVTAGGAIRKMGRRLTVALGPMREVVEPMREAVEPMREAVEPNQGDRSQREPEQENQCAQQ